MKPSGCEKYHPKSGAKIDLTQEEVTSLFSYDRETGQLFWKDPKYKRQLIDPAGYNHKAGYRQVTIKGQGYLVHRIIWLMLTGNQPEELDHINGNKADNRFCNLRAVSKSENQHNTGARIDNSSGYRGISWNKRAAAYTVRIQVKNKRVFIGHYRKILDAVQARNRAKKNMLGERI